MSTQTSSSTTEQKYQFDILALDGLCRDILAALEDHGGSASSKELKADAGVQKNKLHYRLDDVLAELGLVETFTARPESGGKQLKHARLTDRGRDAIDAGLLEDITDANTGLRELRRDIDDLKERIRSKADSGSIHFQLDDLESDIEELKQEVAAIDPSDDLEDLREQTESQRDDLDDLDRATSRLNSAIDDLEDRLTESTVDPEQVDTLADELRAEIAMVRDSVDDRDVSENVSALGRVVRTLADRIEEQDRTGAVDDLEDRQSELADRVDGKADTEDLAAIDDRVSDLEDRADNHLGSYFRCKTNDRLEDLTATVDDLQDRVHRNDARLKTAEDREYVGLPPEDKREYWLEKAEERIEDLGCNHRRPPADAEDQPGRFNRYDKTYKILAHLDDIELQVVKEEDVFDPSVVRAAQRSSIPMHCRYGWLRITLFGWYYRRKHPVR